MQKEKYCEEINWFRPYTRRLESSISKRKRKTRVVIWIGSTATVPLLPKTTVGDWSYRLHKEFNACSEINKRRSGKTRANPVLFLLFIYHRVGDWSYQSFRIHVQLNKKENDKKTRRTIKIGSDLALTCLAFGNSSTTVSRFEGGVVFRILANNTA